LSNQKYHQKNPEMLSPTRYYCHVFKISQLTPQTFDEKNSREILKKKKEKRKRFARVYSSINSLINSN